MIQFWDHFEKETIGENGEPNFQKHPARAARVGASLEHDE